MQRGISASGKARELFGEFDNQDGLVIAVVFYQSSMIISVRTTGGYSPNPYRSILRRKIPEPVIALLAFVLGIWMWDHYFDEPIGYAVGTEEVALLKVDRDLRFADAMASDPGWLKRIAGAGTTEALRDEALRVFLELERHQSLGPRGIEAYAVIRAEVDGAPVLQTLQRFGISDFEHAGDPQMSGGSWWRAKILQAREDTGETVAPWKEAYQQSLETFGSGRSSLRVDRHYWHWWVRFSCRLR